MKTRLNVLEEVNRKTYTIACQINQEITQNSGRENLVYTQIDYKYLYFNEKVLEIISNVMGVVYGRKMSEL